MTTPQATEKFASTDLATLRSELMQAGLDSFQSAELVSSFLIGRGYGVPTGEVRQAVSRIDKAHCSMEIMQKELERLALMM